MLHFEDFLFQTFTINFDYTRVQKSLGGAIQKPGLQI